jgi:hypothetical protein
MPWHIEKRDDKHCVIKDSDGSTEQCHAVRQDAKDHMAALYANEGKKNLGERFIDLIQTAMKVNLSDEKQSGLKITSDANVTLYKDVSGIWRWLLVVSNNRLDREKEILTSDGHRYFVDLLDSGKYKEMMGHDMPELWIWHIGVPVGDAEIVHYDERGYLFAGGRGRKGKFYDKVFAALADKEKSEPGSLAASHGMPTTYIAKDPVNQAYINQYASKEFTVLPREEAANEGTWLPAVLLKESGMDGMPDHKREWFIDTFGEDTFNEFDQFLSTVAREADDAGIPKKELDSMADSTEELKGEDLEETIEGTSEEVVDTPVEEVDATGEEVKQDGDKEDEPEEEEEKDFITRSEMEDLVKSIATGQKAFNDNINALNETLIQIGAEVKQLKEADETKIAEKAATTPQASLSALFGSYATSAIGSDEAKVDYHKERGLHQAGPEESEADVPGTVGIPIVDGFIKEQRTGERAFTLPGQPNGQQS